jgi:RNA polymerase sigma factor (sigma-70 family)
MAEMLKELARQGSDIPDILPILKAFSQDDCTKSPIDPNNPQTKNLRSDIPQVVEPLTNREYDILVLLQQRLSNKEIAEKLNLSTLTVKTHLKNIYEKLGVKQRWDAVTRAIDLGTLPKS